MSFEDFADERAWGLRPPGLPSSCAKPPWPGPPLGWWGFPPRNPNRDVVYFREAVEDIIKNMIRRGELQPGPNAPGQVRPFPLLGVTDGSDAATGIVGEFIRGTGTMTYAAYPQMTVALVSALVVPPGDWDLTASMAVSSLIGGATMGLSPVPAGMSSGMTGAIGFISTIGQTETLSVIIAQGGRGSFSVPTLLTFSVAINQANDNSLPAGGATVIVEARRMR